MVAIELEANLMKELENLMRLLLVEDEPDLGAAIQRSLRREKYVVDWVLNGTSLGYLDPSAGQYVAIFDGSGRLSNWKLLPNACVLSVHMPVLILTAKDRMADRVTGPTAA